MRGFKVINPTEYSFVDINNACATHIDTKNYSSGLSFFTLINDIVNWLPYGFYLYEVETDTEVKDFTQSCTLSNPLDLREISTWEELINKGFDISTKNYDVLQWAVYHSLTHLVKYFVGKGANPHTRGNLLLLAASRGCLDLVKYYYQLGADIHEGREYALRWAAYYGHLEVVKFLVSKGADIHACNDQALLWCLEQSGLDFNRFNPRPKHMEVVRYLISKGADTYYIPKYYREEVIKRARI